MLPWLLGYWSFHHPLAYWPAVQAAGGLLIAVGLVPVVQAFIEFIQDYRQNVRAWIPRLHPWIPASQPEAAERKG